MGMKASCSRIREYVILCPTGTRQGCMNWMQKLVVHRYCQCLRLIYNILLQMPANTPSNQASSQWLHWSQSRLRPTATLLLRKLLQPVGHIKVGDTLTLVGNWQRHTREDGMREGMTQCCKYFVHHGRSQEELLDFQGRFLVVTRKSNSLTM